MKISELIERLEDLEAKHGDVDLFIISGDPEFSVSVKGFIKKGSVIRHGLEFRNETVWHLE